MFLNVLNKVTGGIISCDPVPTLGSLETAAKPVELLVAQIMKPLIGIVSAVAVVYCVFLGLKLAKADEPQEREKAKGALKNAIIGYLLIFVLILVLRQVAPILGKWVGAM